MRGFWFYSRVGDAESVHDFIFLFLMLIKGTKRQDVFKIICMAPGIERLSLCLQQTVKNIVCALVGKFKCGKVG